MSTGQRTSLFRKQALDFQQDSLAGEVLIPLRLSYASLTAFLGCLFASIVCFLLLGTYSKTERVLGYLSAAEGVSKLSAERSGIVKSIKVSEGDYVEPGELLLVVETAVSVTNGSSVESQALKFALAEKSLIERQISLLTERHDSNLEQLAREIESIETKIDSLLTQLELQEAMTKSAKASRDNVEALMNKNYISRLEYENLEQTLNSYRIQENIIGQDIESLRLERERLLLERSQLPGQTEQKIAELERQVLDINTLTAQLSGQMDYIIRAPVSGYVSSISASVVGQSIAIQSPLLTVVPEDRELVAELYIPSSAIGFIQEGQQVELLYDAFPYQQFGSFPANISEVTEIIMMPNEIESPVTLQQPVYRARADLKQQSLNIAGRDIDLQLGMTFQGIIILERRSFMDWLLAPLNSVIKR